MRNVIERAVILNEGDTIMPLDLRLSVPLPLLDLLPAGREYIQFSLLQDNLHPICQVKGNLYCMH